MNLSSVQRLALVGIAAASACVVLGLLVGLLGAGAAPAHVELTGAETLPALTLRDPVLALRALDAGAHWGRYEPPAAVAAGAESAVAAPRPVAASDLERAYRLVGVEQRGAELLAVILPAGAAGPAQSIRLRIGDSLGEGARVSEIGHDSIRFATPGGSPVLHLYGNPP